LQAAEIQEVQRRLSAMGFEAGGSGDNAGPRLREALEAFGIAASLPAAPALTVDLLPLLRQPAPPPARRAAALLDMAEAASQRRDDATGQRLAAASLAISPTARGHLLAGDAAMRRGQTEAARQAFEAARALGSADAVARLAALPPAAPRPLQRAEVQDVQRRLNAMGFDAGGTDGSIGPRLREALRAFAIAADLPGPPELNSDVLPRLRVEAPAPARRAAALLDLAEAALRQGDNAGALRLAPAAIRISAALRAVMSAKSTSIHSVAAAPPEAAW
jgi:peptidoglycan hydrolase-like protein with peptidoglycan-binding domain